MDSSADRTTSIAFLGIVIFGGLNGLAVKYTIFELDPFWGAALRFLLAAVLLGGIVMLRRLPLPRGRALAGSVLYGLLGFAIPYALMYYGIVEAPAGLLMVMLALVPLLTLLLAVAQGLEKLRRRGPAGALLAIGGVAIIFAERVGAQGDLAVPLLSLLAILGATVALAETGVVVKSLPRAHPVVNNTLAMAIGGLVLLGVAIVAGDAMVIPAQPQTIAATVYLVLGGSIALFMLFLYVIERWSASATSYAVLLMPIVTIALGAILLAEPITVGLLGGAALIVAGVYLGAFAPSLTSPWPISLRRPPTAAAAAAAAGADPEAPSIPCP